MTDYSLTAVSEIRNFLWENLQADKILNKNNYIADGFRKPLIPIIPTQQVPEFNNLLSGKTYIFYDYMINSYNEDYWKCNESIMLNIVSNDHAEINKIINYLVDLFRRMDDTAKDINSSASVSDLFKYYYFYINSVSSPEPFEEEGGNQIATVDISYQYSRQIGNNGRFV